MSLKYIDYTHKISLCWYLYKVVLQMNYVIQKERKDRIFQHYLGTILNEHVLFYVRGNMLLMINYTATNRLFGKLFL